MSSYSYSRYWYYSHSRLFLHTLVALVLFALVHGGAYEGCTGDKSVYHFRVGNFEAAILSDGDLVMQDNPFDTPLIAVHRSYRNLSLSLSPYRFAQNALLLKKEEHVILVDTGLGSYKGHGENAGNLVGNLKLFNVLPHHVTHILITHGHFDHVGGLVTKDDKPVFPNAKIFLSNKEYQWWMHEAKLLHETQLPKILQPNSKLNEMKGNNNLNIVSRVGAEAPVTETLLREFRRSMKPYPNSIILIEDEHIPINGITMKSTPGHTPGHMSVFIRSGGDELFVAGDMVLGEASNLVHPEWVMSIEQNKTQAIETRFKILDMLSATNSKALLYHEAFPGIGNVRKVGSTTFAWKPTENTIDTVLSCRGYQLEV